MNRYSLKLAAISAVIILGITTLSACGGGNGGGPGGDLQGGPRGVEVPDEEFDLFTQSGTWTIELDYDLKLNETEINSDVNIKFNTATTVQFNSSTNVVADFCDVEPAERFLSGLIQENDVLELNLTPNCDASRKLFKVSDSHFRIENYCGGDLESTMGFNKVSDSSVFDFGSLSFSSSTYPNLDTSDGVCGSVMIGSGTVSGTDPIGNAHTTEIELVSIVVVAPYDAGLVSFELLSYEGIRAGTYDIDINDINFEMISQTLGGSSMYPASVDAFSGTVTIESVSVSAAKGRFDVLLQNGDAVTGEFDFALN